MAGTLVGRRLRRAVAAAAVAGGIVCGLPIAPAAAAVGTISAKLAVGPDMNDIYRGPREVTVTGTVPMTRTEANAFLATGHTVVMRLWGDDPYYDDLISGPTKLLAYASDSGITFKLSHNISEFQLNEDNAFALDRDELYAGVRLLNPNGVTFRSAETNRVNGYF